jgi:pSer/pThr/pTyr-binding forkhead associated (FHA) protein
MLARLTVHFPFQPTRSFVVDGDADTVIGRDPGCDIVLDDDRVSRRHARLAVVGGAWQLSDLDSKNGTSLQGLPMREAALEREGWISFGGLLARFERSTADRERAETLRHEERRKTSVSLQQELTPSLGLERLLERVLGSVLELSGAERGVVLLQRGDGAMDIAARRNLANPELTDSGFSGSVGAIERALSTVRSVAVSDASLDPELRGRQSVIGGGIRSLICIPLVTGERLIGVIYADSGKPGTSFGELDVEILEALAAHAALAIALARADRELKGLAARLPGAGTAADWAGVVAHHQSRTGEPS